MDSRKETRTSGILACFLDLTIVFKCKNSLALLYYKISIKRCFESKINLDTCNIVNELIEKDVDSYSSVFSTWNRKLKTRVGRTVHRPNHLQNLKQWS